MKTAVRNTLALGMIATVGLGTAACGSDSEGEDTLKICTNVPFAPFEVRDGSEYSGFDIDMMNLVAENTNQTIEWVEIEFDAIQSGDAFAAGTCEIGAAGLSITPERQENLGMSQAYFRADQALAVVTGSDIASFDDLDGTSVGVQSGSTGADYAESISEEYGFEIVSFASMGDVTNAMAADTVQASIADLSNWKEVATTNDKVEIAAQVDTQEYYGFATGKDNTELLETINSVIDDSLSNGEYQTIYKKWIGTDYNDELAQANS